MSAKDRRASESVIRRMTRVADAYGALNLFAGFCAGCAVYYWLNRLQVPGFARTPPPGTFPGMRPRA